MLRTMLDFTLFGRDVWEALKLKDPILVGHSMGGMIAAEMAAVSNTTVEQLALICPAGLWLDDDPIPDLFAKLPFELPELLFHEPAKYTALLSAGGDFNDPEFLTDFLVGNARRMGTAGKILFPIPDRGLSERLYRIRARTQIIWGSRTADSAGLRLTFRRRHRRCEADDDRRRGAHGAVRTDRRWCWCFHREAAQLSCR
jgi:pimeloyl-ACP methyl ester carboxylesterase